MSPSWNSILARFWPSSPGAVALGISGDCLVAVRAERDEEKYSVTHVAEERLPFVPFRGAMPRNEDSQSMAGAIERLAALVPQKHWPLQVALPDPSAIFQVMEFDSLPGSAAERAAIARFRMEREWPGMVQMECATQVLGNEEGNALLLALAVQHSWLDSLRDGCRAAGLVPHVIDISVNHIFNLYYDLIDAVAGDGALISLEADTWSIIFWDQTHRPRFVRNRWRDLSGEKDADYEVIANDIERLVRAYVLAEPGRKIERMHLCAAEADSASFSQYLDARMSVPCVRFDMAERFSPVYGVSIQDIPPAVLAAAVPRS